MNKAYDTQHAQQLVPLLESIVREVADRLHEIRILESRIGRIEAEAGEQASSEFFDLKASLATHRREIRLATRELERLGCVVDGRHPLRIIIPGSDGNLDHGFQWDPSDPMLRRVSTGTRVS